jgi:hypothetical protein
MAILRGRSMQTLPRNTQESMGDEMSWWEDPLEIMRRADECMKRMLDECSGCMSIELFDEVSHVGSALEDFVKNDGGMK